MILVNWAKLGVLPWYVTAVKNSRIVGRYLAHVMRWLEAQKAVPLSKIHVIGFSLGAEAAGFMGKALAPRKVRCNIVRSANNDRQSHNASHIPLANRRPHYRNRISAGRRDIDATDRPYMYIG